MKYHRYSEQEVIDKTREAIHLFIQKQITPFSVMLDGQFVWIGDYESLYMKGVSNFLENVKDEMKLPSIKITDEEYALLSHDRSLWVSYGRFTATINKQSTKIHFTFVWKQKENDLWLLHANANHAKKMELSEAQSHVFEQSEEKDINPYHKNKKKRTLRDLDGSIHYLLADDILFIKAENKTCEIFTKNGSFKSRVTMKEMEQPPMIRLHKSYLCNLGYLRKICRYKATLAGGIIVPMGREYYMGVKMLLAKEETPTSD